MLQVDYKIYLFLYFDEDPLIPNPGEAEKLLEETTNLSISNKPINTAVQPVQDKDEPPFNMIEELKHMLPHKLLIVNMFAFSGMHLFAQNFHSY